MSEQEADRVLWAFDWRLARDIGVSRPSDTELYFARFGVSRLNLVGITFAEVAWNMAFMRPLLEPSEAP